MRHLLAASLLGLAARPALALPGVTHYVNNSILRYYDANNAVTASQLLGAPMPLTRAKPFDWRLDASPAFNQVSAKPLFFSGGSLNLGYSIRLGGGWGFYAAALSNFARSHATSDDGAPNGRMIRDYFFFGVSGLQYSGTMAPGGTISTFGQGFGPTYTFWRDRPDRFPITLFAGPVFSQSFARKLHREYDFTGTVSGSGYRLHGTVDQNLTVYFQGASIGAVAEIPVGRHFLIIPHAYEVILASSRQTGTLTQREVESGAVSSDSTSVYSVNEPVGMVYFPIPGVDVVYRDWAFGLNLVEPFGGVIARTTAKDFLHGAWPFTLSVSKSFGNFER
jgi:hypothetical protein